MRVAKIVSRIDVPAKLRKWDLPELSQGHICLLQEQLPERTTNFLCDLLHHTPLRRDIIQQIKDKGFSVYAAQWAKPHIDQELPNNVTFGIVLRGDHVLTTGIGSVVGDLLPGTVYVLNNKKHHGAKKRTPQTTEPLIVATSDLNIPYTFPEIFCTTF